MNKNGKLDIIDLMLVDDIYSKFVEGKHSTGYIYMEGRPLDITKLDRQILKTDDQQVYFILDIGTILHHGPSDGEYVYMDIIYTVVNEQTFICAVYDRYVILYYTNTNDNHDIVIINCEYDEDLYFKFYTLAMIIKDFYELN